MHTNLFLKLISIVFITFMSFENNYEIPIHYYKVSFQTKSNTLKYYYKKGKDSRILEFILRDHTASLKISFKEGTIALLSTNKKSGQRIFTLKGKVYSYSKGLVMLDPFSTTILLNHPIINSIVELVGLYPQVSNIKIVEGKHIQQLGAQDEAGATTTQGSVTGFCTCGSKTITVTCPTGSAIDCTPETLTICKVDSNTSEEFGCRTKTFCIGYCYS